jgi:hypothetical protein
MANVRQIGSAKTSRARRAARQLCEAVKPLLDGETHIHDEARGLVALVVPAASIPALLAAIAEAEAASKAG